MSTGTGSAIAGGLVGGSVLIVVSLIIVGFAMLMGMPHAWLNRAFGEKRPAWDEGEGVIPPLTEAEISELVDNYLSDDGDDLTTDDYDQWRKR